jgi:glutamate--cysteine ligase
MARDIDSSTPVSSRTDLIAWMEEGCKSRDEFRVGTEHEKFVYNTNDGSPVPYEGARGIKALLTGMHGLLGWQPIIDADNIIGLVDVVGGGAISLEPGGQFELSGAPLKTIHETACEIRSHMAQVHEVAAPLGLDFFAAGTCPDWQLKDIPVMPKARYRIMSGYMPKVGSRGLDMMFRTCTVQANLDFSSEADMVKKLRVSVALQPLATALFANSTHLDGKPTGFLSTRSEIWRDTDNNRTGMLAFAFEDGMGFERYVDWALNVPMYFVKRGNTYHDVTGSNFKDLMAGRLEAMPNETATVADWANHLSTTFPEVRLKRYLEMRGADAGPMPMLTALPAFWVGLLYDEPALDAAWDIVKPWSAAQRQNLRDQVPRLGLDTQVDNKLTLRNVAKEVLQLARSGLARRGRLDRHGCDETRYLTPLMAILDGATQDDIAASSSQILLGEAKLAQAS